MLKLKTENGCKTETKRKARIGVKSHFIAPLSNLVTYYLFSLEHKLPDIFPKSTTALSCDAPYVPGIFPFFIRCVLLRVFYH